MRQNKSSASLKLPSEAKPPPTNGDLLMHSKCSSFSCFPSRLSLTFGGSLGCLDSEHRNTAVGPQDCSSAQSGGPRSTRPTCNSSFISAAIIQYVCESWLQHRNVLIYKCSYGRSNSNPLKHKGSRDSKLILSVSGYRKLTLTWRRRSSQSRRFSELWLTAQSERIN